jgi:hypothetical protein
MKAENILKNSGLDILLIPSPRALSTDCGLAIRYNRELSDSVLQLLTSENLLPEFIYMKASETEYETFWSFDNSRH